MKEWKAAEKETQKMTRDGAISVNMVTGKASRVSDRAPEQDYSPSGDSAAFVHSAAERLDDRRIHKSEKKKRRKQRRSYREGTAARAASSLSAALSDLRIAFCSSGAARSSSENCKREDGRSLAAVPSR